jgi:hypothetical protein
MIQVPAFEVPALDPPKRGRGKKAQETAVKDPETIGSAELPERTDAGDAVSPTKPKRTRRVGEPTPQCYPIGERETKQNI